jgi:MFS family permease
MHKEKLDRRKLRITGFISFLVGFGQAILIYIMSSYFKEASGTENVGIFYLAAYVIELLVLFNLHKMVSSYGHARTFLLIILAQIPFLVLLSAVAPSITGIIFLMFYITVGNVTWVALDMILESCSVDRMSGRIRGLHLTILNAGFLFGPYLSTLILERFNYGGVFVFMVILYSIIFIYALLGLRDFKSSVERRSGARELILAVMKRKNILRIYCVSFALEFFYALMVIFTPLYLRDLGLGWDSIGIIFTVMLVPFVIFQYPVGLLADKKTGEKELIILALFVMGLATLLVYLTHSTSIFVWALILFATRIGASFLEILRDSYFYKRISCDDIDLIDFFRTARPVAYIAGSIISTMVLLHFPLKSVFLLVAFVSFFAIWPAVKLVDNKSEREKAAARPSGN